MHHFKITKNIKNLNIQDIHSNLLKYKYDKKRLKRLFNAQDMSEALYSSFKGEIYENIIYEHLVLYAQNEPLIRKFILKGPHQNSNSSRNKSGLLIDSSAQIVYKASYKDISEFDALFFTDDSLYFVEMSTSKKTASLNKRLLKKHALLKVLFPSYEIRALIVLTEGSIGLSNFPSYCTVWVTQDLEDEELLREIVFGQVNKKNKLYTPKDKKYIDVLDLQYSNFKYFQTLNWILREARNHKHFSVDLNFFNTKYVDLYFDIYTKLYIGHISLVEFQTILPQYNEAIKNDKIIVTIEKLNTKSFGVVYYAKQSRDNQLKRIRMDAVRGLSIKDKEAEGFTNAEVKFMMNVLNDSHVLKKRDIDHINKNISIIKI